MIFHCGGPAVGVQPRRPGAAPGDTVQFRQPNGAADAGMTMVFFKGINMPTTSTTATTMFVMFSMSTTARNKTRLARIYFNLIRQPIKKFDQMKKV